MPPVKLYSQALPWKGLYTVGGKDAPPQGALRRARGVARVHDGPLRSRLGSTLSHALDAHSLMRFGGNRYAGATTKFYKNGVEIKSGLDGTRLTFAKMPPTLAKQDYLFAAGGGQLFKVDPAGVVTLWGIVAPSVAPTITDNGVAGSLPAGVYTYYITHLNQSSGHRSNPSPVAQINTTVNHENLLNNIPISLDSQVTAREIWRSVANGTLTFLLAVIADNTTLTYGDRNQDTLTAQQLPTDNAPPESTFEDCVGPFDGRMWWCRNTAIGTQGRVYFSPQGRPESVEGFLDVSNPDDATQKLSIWNGLWVTTNRTVKRLVSTLTQPLETRGVPGTTKPFTVHPTPQGLLYESDEGVRLFNGVDSVLVSVNALGTLFQGVASENLSAMSGVLAGYARDEYIISDETQALALNTRTSAWRDLGLGLRAVLYEDDTEKVQVSALGKVLLFEEEGLRADDGVAVAFAVEFPSSLVDASSEGLVQRLYLDCHTNGQAITPVILLDGVETTLATFSTSTRTVVEIPVLRKGRLIGLRLTGVLTAEVVLYDATVDVYIPQLVAV